MCIQSWRRTAARLQRGYEILLAILGQLYMSLSDVRVHEHRPQLVLRCANSHIIGAHICVQCGSMGRCRALANAYISGSKSARGYQSNAGNVRNARTEGARKGSRVRALARPECAFGTLNHPIQLDTIDGPCVARLAPSEPLV